MEKEILIKDLIQKFPSDTTVIIAEPLSDEDMTAKEVFRGKIADIPYKFLNCEVGSLFLNTIDGNEKTSHLALNIIIAMWVVNTGKIEKDKSSQKNIYEIPNTKFESPCDSCPMKPRDGGPCANAACPVGKVTC